MIQDQYLQLLKDNSLSNQIIDAYLIQKHNLISYFANIIVYGPIALLNAEQICSTKLSQQYVTVLRKNYETLLCLNEQHDDKKLISQTQDSFKTYFQEQILDYQYLNFLSDLKDNPYIKNLTQDQWLDQIQEFIEISTIQEINQTQILKEQFQSGYQTKERKRFEYLYFLVFSIMMVMKRELHNKAKKMNKIRTRYVEQNQFQYQKSKKDKDVQNEEGDEEGYEASNSDHKTKQTKMSRRRRKQANNQEFDTDRENKQKV
ncbi:unnamed protein product (macronuclear) [Paramecium tetraurelia]|uniref:Uncharacterized protein n=1 Tax=Paramecium tetraurelia TaxID=5888 RepID=A0CLK3_PARTE|nr:uncharacterized protein GSPATT00008219001 [Paramecium tetraurelia]CAK71670.1 unnamed protein product [Paramecium tetraurelia]|eukprot:XP_001439067.1 hypothetical protein (macronuclear) [Paramecium tetraurelia strain d4-2]